MRRIGVTLCCLVAACSGPGAVGASDLAPSVDDLSPSVVDLALACSGGMLACGSPAMCVDPTTSGQHCGRCDHDCQGGACVAGSCQPVALAIGQANPVKVAVDATNVYFSNNAAAPGGSIQVCAKAGCNQMPTTLADNQPYPGSLAVSGANLIWTVSGTGPTFADGGIRYCNRNGCAVAGGSVLVANYKSALGVAVDATTAYFGQLTNPGVVSSCLLAGCGGTPTSLVSAQVYPSGVAVDDTNVYFASYGSGKADGSITLCAKGGCGDMPTTLASAQFAVSGLALDATTVYWTSQGTAPNFNDGKVLSCVKTGCGNSPTVIATGQLGAYDIVVDGSVVYWENRGTRPNLTDGSIVSCPKTGCPGSGPTVLAAGQLDPTGLAIDATTLYWGSYSLSGAVKKLAR
jgi:hypothetical protein